MEPQTLKNVIVAGASGIIGTPIVAALLANGSFNVSALSRAESKATFPSGVAVKKVDLTSYTDLVKAFKGQDVVICTLNDANPELQPQIIEAAFEAGVKRFMQNEWASHDMNVPGTPLEEGKAGKRVVVELLNRKVKDAKEAGKEFHWTGINCGIFIDWALYSGFIDITLPPTKTAIIWDSGSNPATCTNLSTVATAVIATLTTAEVGTRDRLLNIQSFKASQNDIVEALEKATGEKWSIEKTTTKEQLALAQEYLEKGDFLPALYRWIRTFVFSGHATLPNIENELLGLPKEDLQTTVEKVIKGEKI